MIAAEILHQTDIATRLDVAARLLRLQRKREGLEGCSGSLKRSGASLKYTVAPTSTWSLSMYRILSGPVPIKMVMTPYPSPLVQSGKVAEHL